jgi:cytidyltransferase-like protein
MKCKTKEDLFILLDHIDKLQNLSRQLIVGVTSGVFDLLHPLHVLYLEKCKRECDYLVVFIDSDELVKTQKNRIPIFNEEDRCTMISSLKSVDSVCLNTDYNIDVKEFVESFEKKNIIVFKNSNLIYGKEVNTFGYPLKIIDDVIRPESSTMIRHLIQG